MTGMDWKEGLEQLVAAPGVSGDEGPVREVLAALAAPYADECRADALGNLICRRRGAGPRVMLAAHMDCVGLMVTHVEQEGFLRVNKVGGLKPARALDAVVCLSGGGVGRVCAQTEELDKLRWEELYLDVGAGDAEAARQLAAVGDTAVYAGAPRWAGSRVISPRLDNRIGCLALLMALEQLKDTPNDVYAVFTAQEEVGLRGARAAAYAIDPDYGLAIDVTGCDDTPGSRHRASARLGGGAAVKVMDGSVICHPQVVNRLNQLADGLSIPVQPDVLSSGGTDAGAISPARMGVLTGGISIPCRYIHSPAEMADWQDVEACARLAAAFAACPLPAWGGPVQNSTDKE